MRILLRTIRREDRHSKRSRHYFCTSSGLVWCGDGSYGRASMRRVSTVFCLVGVCVGGAVAQDRITKTKKKEEVFITPTDALSERMRRNYTDQDARDYYWQVREDTMPSERKVVKGVEKSETTPWRSAHSLWASQTMVQRSRERGAGELSKKATEGPTLGERLDASRNPEVGYPGKSRDDAILAAVYRHFFGYRARGFGRDTTVYFLGLGPHKEDAPPSVIASLQKDPTVVRDKVTLRPASRSLEVTDAEIRDLDSGAYGAVFRVDEIGPVEANGDVKVTATFGEKNGFFFTQQLTLRDEKGAWKVVGESDLPVSQ